MTEADATESSLSIAIVGSGGAGVMTIGNLLLDAAAQAGLYALMTRSFGPQIRGGEAGALLRLASHPVDSAGDAYDVLLGIDWKNAERFAGEIPLTGDSVIIADPAAGEIPDDFAATGARVLALPMQELAKAAPGGRANMVALGALTALLDLPQETLTAVLHKTLHKKGPEMIQASLDSAARGAAHAAGLDARFPLPPRGGDSGTRWSITGNQAAALGAIRGGVRFAAAYPITPATDVLEWLAPALPRVGGTLVQAEDELASINMALGASYGGRPAFTATSGPGVSLMSEAIGLGVASETPVVVLDVMRGGPSTGIPTKSEQTDLNIALYGLHGDAPHLVLAPSSIPDCLFTLQWAVFLAEMLQTPAIVLSDQAMGQARAVIRRPSDVAFLGRRALAENIDPEVGYQRYAITASGVSPVALPGTPGGQHTADGLEHNEAGTPSAKIADHEAQLDKRLRKLVQFDYGTHWAEIEGDPQAPFAVLTWGSTTPAVREGIARARADGLAVRLISPRLLYPARPEAMAAALAGVERILVVEHSHSAQFARYLRAEYDLPCRAESFHRPGPAPMIRPADVHARLMTWRNSHA